LASELLFDTPWWLLALLAVAGAALFISGNARLEKRLKLAGLGLVAAAVLLLALSRLVDTDREKVEKQTRQLMAAVVQRDQQGVRRQLHPQASLGVWNRDDIAYAASCTPTSSSSPARR
jgi:4-amino-4-deoxy-L-arabinose transferase-like glycosyltransferase